MASNLNYLLGPHLGPSVKAIPQLLNFMGPQADMKALFDSAMDAGRGLFAGDMGKFGTNMALGLTAPLFLLYPGTSRTAFGYNKPFARPASSPVKNEPLLMAGGSKDGGAIIPQPSQSQIQQARKLENKLTIKQLEKLEEAKKLYPRFGELAKYMMPLEIGPVLNTAYGPRNVERLLDVLPNAENFAAAAKMGRPKRGWYEASAKSIHDVFGDDAPRFASLLAATSPQNSVEMNMLNALSIWKNWTAVGRPKDKASIKEIMGASVTGDKGQDSVLDAWVNNTVRSLASDNPVKMTLSGPKVDSFFRNLVGDVQRITNDAHMANLAGIRQDLLRVSPTDMQLARGNPGMTPAYAALSGLQRLAAQKLGFNPAEVQETAWSLTKPLTELQASTGLRARDILQKGLLTPDDIRGTVDFATLMKDPIYANLLESAGYGSRLAALKPVRFGDNVPNLNLAEQNELMKIGARLEKLGDIRAREARAKQFQVGGVPRSAMVYQTEEAVPGNSLRHLSKLIDESFGTRQAYTGRAKGALTDPQGMDIIHSNLGMKTVATRPMQGVYQDKPGAVIQLNPGFSAGVEVPLTTSGKISKKDQKKLTGAATLRGALLGQEGSPYTALIPAKRGRDAFILRPDKLSEKGAKEYIKKYGMDKAYLVDTGQGVGLLNQTSKPHTSKELIDLGSLLGKPKKKGAKPPPAIIAKQVQGDNNYIDLTAEWSKKPGSRAVSQRVIDAFTSADLKKVDQPNIRRAAEDLYKLAESRAKKGDPVRDDVMNFYKIIAEKGLAGLKKAVKAKEFLPVIASLGLMEPLLRNLRSEQAAETSF